MTSFFSFLFPLNWIPLIFMWPSYQVQVPLMLVLSIDFVAASLLSVKPNEKVKEFSQYLLTFLYH